MENPKKRKRTGAERDRRKAELLEAKRKEEEAAAQAGVLSGSHEVENDALAQRVAGRIPLGIKHLRGVFKLAKTRETGRVVKKVKGMRGKEGKEKEVKELEVQLALLSHIRITPLVVSHLQSKISRLPTYRHTPLPSSIFTALAIPSTSTAEPSAVTGLRSKVENRLLSAKGVGMAVTKVVEWLVSEEGTRLSQAGVPKEKDVTRRRAASTSSIDEEALHGGPRVAKEIVGELVSDLEEELDDDDAEDEEVDEAGWESGSIDDVDHPATVNNSSGSEEEELDIDSDEDQDDLRTPPRSKMSTKEKAKPSKSSTKDLSSSLFLPSLASGFTRGNDSDSDPDLDMDDTGTIGKVRKGQDRKNRRGQRARQAIWEKKFGKHAKHVAAHRKEEAEEAAKKAERREKRAAKYEARAGVSAPAPERKPFRGQGSNGSRPNYNTAAAPTPASVPVAGAPGKHVHPSWEAARLRKQQESAAANAPKATKIVFD